jgi:Flp pilus assembly protein TadG
MSHSDLPKNRPGERRRRRRRGQELIEFCFCIVPLFAILFVYMDIAWAIFVKATLEQAVRVGVRYGITNVVPDPNQPLLCAAASSLSDCVKMHVQWAAGSTPGTSFPLSGGILGGAANGALISVTYYEPTTAGLPLATGTLDASGNVMMVSITNYPLYTLFPPYIAQPGTTNITVNSADTVSGVATLPTGGP